jgi:hypothetical protein
MSTQGNPKGNLCVSASTFAPLFTLVLVKAAAVLGQPFPKCGVFHHFVPMYL